MHLQETDIRSFQPAVVLKDLAWLLGNLSNEQYAQKLPVLSQYSVGAHCRHVLEFYQCLQKGLNDNFICYEDRKRDGEIESDREYALELINTLMLWNVQQDKPAILQVGASSDKEKHYLKSSLFRELHYVAEHSIHHFALIKIGVQALGKPIPDFFGIANSTIAYQSQCVS